MSCGLWVTWGFTIVLTQKFKDYITWTSGTAFSWAFEGTSLRMVCQSSRVCENLLEQTCLVLQLCRPGAQMVKKMGKAVDNLPRSKMGKKWPKNTEKMENRVNFSMFSAFLGHLSPFSIRANCPRFFPFFPILLFGAFSIVYQARMIASLVVNWALGGKGCPGDGVGDHRVPPGEVQRDSRVKRR